MGWTIGDALVTVATVRDVEVVLDLVTNRNYGKSRQMIVHSMWRFKRDSRTVGVLLNLIEEPDVSPHAMSALRRTEGNEAALPHLVTVRDSNPDPTVRKQATVEVKKAEKALSTVVTPCPRAGIWNVTKRLSGAACNYLGGDNDVSSAYKGALQ